MLSSDTKWNKIHVVVDIILSWRRKKSWFVCCIVSKRDAEKKSANASIVKLLEH